MNLLINWVTGFSLKAWLYIGVAITILLTLMKVYSAGRMAERVENLQHNSRVREQQLKATARARARDAVAEMRAGRF